MRKVFCGLTVAAVAMVGGMIWLKWQGPVTPYAYAATAAISSCGNSPGGSVLAGTLSGGAAMFGDNPSDALLSDEDLAEFIKPEDPVEDGTTLKDPVPDLASTNVVELTPTPVVPAITIREPIEVAKPVSVAGSGIWAGEYTTGTRIDPAILQANATAIGQAHGEVQTVPRVMPYCEDDEPPAVKMEYATEDTVPEVLDEDDDFNDEKPGFWSLFLPAPVKRTSNYHSPVPGGAEDSEALPVPQRKTSLKSLHEQLHKLTNNGEAGTLLPAVDTMEFRPSDHSPYERSPNPL